ncbi:MAG: phosphate ABC transporter substrate-binding protein [Planctomycetia bacterium]|nr:phosphate ABC transporter substrate-binding protein [Planctomycetia bacterium]
MRLVKTPLRSAAVVLALSVAAPCTLAVRAADKSSVTLVDPALSAYHRAAGVSGAIKSVGSDTMNNLMTLWAEGFKNFYPSVRAEIEGKGSSTAPPALIVGTATFGPMSRDMKPSEIDAFERKYGYKPVLLPAAIDMLAVYVHRDNPLRSLTLAELDAIYSPHRLGGYRHDLHAWGQLGLAGAWRTRHISLYGRNAASGTNGYFKEKALLGGDFKESVKELPGSSSVVQAVAADRYSIGYSGVGFASAGVRAVPLAFDADSPAVPPAPRFAASGEYPLARFLWIAVNHQPGSQLDPLRREFIKYVYSREGQSDVVKDGYFPVTRAMAAASLAAVGLGESPQSPAGD